MAHADLVVPSVDDGKGPRVHLTRDDGEVIVLTVEEAWGRIEDAQPGVGVPRGACGCEACALFSCVRHLR